jgi:uncharacterized membrane protein
MCLMKYCIEKEKRRCLLASDGGAIMVSLIITIFAMVPMVTMLSLSVSMYRWEQQNLEAENLAEENIYTCRKTAQREVHTSDYEIPEDEINKMKKALAICDNSMLYYKGRCELDSTKFFCSKSILEGYLILRGLEDADRPSLFAKT